MGLSRDFSEILSSQLVALTGGVIAGTLLAIFTDKLFLLPGFLILLPGFLELKGAIAGSMAARLGTELHTKKIKASGKSKLVTENEEASFILIFFVSLILGIFTYLLTYYLFGSNNPRLILIPLVASIISSILLFPLTVKLTLWIYRNHKDPDNVMGPYITSIGDIESIIALLITIAILT
ncbi:magnesium transporter [Candidatus Woesearchaeota archaeon]|nr:magnesium transporter [Candidatus Woesearchaeota archaeon]